MPENAVVFGWGAPPMKEQHPVLSAEEAEHLDKDNLAIARLSVRGLITESQRNAAYKKLTRSVETSIATALKATSGCHEQNPASESALR